jgi:hypothetical protein
MARIVIKDLSDSSELDREAMLAIVGGTRSGGRPWRQEAEAGRPVRIVDYPAGMGAARPRKPGRGAKG